MCHLLSQFTFAGGTYFYCLSVRIKRWVLKCHSHTLYGKACFIFICLVDFIMGIGCMGFRRLMPIFLLGDWIANLFSIIMYTEKFHFSFGVPRCQVTAQDTIIPHGHQDLKWPQGSWTGEYFRFCVSPSGLHHRSPRQEIKYSTSFQGCLSSYPDCLWHSSSHILS